MKRTSKEMLSRLSSEVGKRSLAAEPRKFWNGSRLSAGEF